MAQLFQPTNITPDTRGSFGNGIVEIDITVIIGDEETVLPDFVDVSWQVNGNTAMTAFQIDFTDMSGNALYSTGKLTGGCPFYGTNANGETQRFSFRIDLSEEANPFVRQASEGLMRITQWWGSGANDFVAQQSPSHYLVKKQVSAWFNPSGEEHPITGRNGTFTGSFSNASQDGMMWTRWVLTRKDTGQVVKDTGKLYGSVEPTFTYDGFLPGVYSLSLSGETSSGLKSVNGTYDVYVDYTLLETGFPVSASRACNGESAVSVRWPRLQSIPLTSQSGTVTDDGNAITLDDGASLTWNTVNSRSMDFSTPWTAVWCGSVTVASGRLFEIQTSNARYRAYVNDISGEGVLMLDITVQSSSGPPVPPQTLTLYAEWNEGPLMCIVTPTAVYWKFLSDKGPSLFPGENLYPSESLYPGGLEGTATMVLQQEIPSVVTQRNITSVSLYGPSSVEYFQILDHAMQETEINQYLTGNADVNYGVDSLFYIEAEGGAQDYNAGSWPETLRDGTTISVYRKTEESSVLDYVGQTIVAAGNTILDYAARSQQGPYIYYLYVLSSEQYINAPSVSNAVNPCFWDWEVLSCTQNADGSYSVQASYRFGKNLQSGSVSNNNQPGVFKNFTPYPTVMIAPQNYQSGTLQSLIGVVSDGVYSDTIDLRNAIYSLSLTTNTLFLKNRKGDLLRIRPGEEITMETMDNTRAQALTVSFPWVEVGGASNAAIYGTGGAS